MDIKKIKKDLEEKKKEIICFLPLSSDNKNADISDYDLAHHYQVSEQQNSLSSYNQNILSQINRALEKIEEGTYGICDQCKKEIDIDRLMVIPYANLCMDCVNRFPSKLVYSTNDEGKISTD